MKLDRRRPPKLPAELDQPEVLAFIAAMLAWHDGDPVPRPPKQLTMSVPELVEKLGDPDIRAGVVRRLSPLVRPVGRALPWVHGYRAGDPARPSPKHGPVMEVTGVMSASEPPPEEGEVVRLQHDTERYEVLEVHEETDPEGRQLRLLVRML